MDIVYKNIRLLKFMASHLPFLPFCVTGVKNLDHNLRPRPWPVKWKVLKLVKPKYADFRPTLAAAYLDKQYEEQVSKARLRQILNGGGSARLLMQAGSFFFGASDERSVGRHARVSSQRRQPYLPLRNYNPPRGRLSVRLPSTAYHKLHPRPVFTPRVTPVNLFHASQIFRKVRHFPQHFVDIL